MVGTITKKGDRCRAFKVGKKVTVEYLNKFVPEEYRATDFVYKSDLRLADAKEKYPEWYQRRIVEGRPRKTWICKRICMIGGFVSLSQELSKGIGTGAL